MTNITVGRLKIYLTFRYLGRLSKNHNCNLKVALKQPPLMPTQDKINFIEFVPIKMLHFFEFFCGGLYNKNMQRRG